MLHPKPGRGRGRAGLTLVEAVVVVAIVGLLLAISIPAVQRAREASRAGECRARLKQIGLALHAFEQARGSLPAGILPDTKTKGGVFLASGPLSVQYQLLPYLEQAAVFNSLNVLTPLKESPSDYPEYSFPATRPMNQTAVGTRIEVFLCPSDAHPGGPSTPGNSYRACAGPHPLSFDLPGRASGGGVFPGFKGVTMGDVRDGASFTAAFSERLRGSGTRFDTERDVWYTSLGKTGISFDATRLLEICASLAPPAGLGFPNVGGTWANSSFEDTLYNHVAGPGPRFADCSLNGPLIWPGDSSSGGMFSARSRHASVVHVLTLDGSVRPTKVSVDLRVWRAVATRSGQETGDADAF